MKTDFKPTFKKFLVRFYYSLFLFVKWIREKVEALEIYLKDKYEAKQDIVTNETLEKKARQKSETQSQCVEESMEEGTSTCFDQKQRSVTFQESTVRNIDRSNYNPYNKIENASCEKTTAIMNLFKDKINIEMSERTITCIHVTADTPLPLASDLMVHLLGENKITSDENYREIRYKSDDFINMFRKHLKNTQSLIYGLIIEKHVIMVEQLIDGEAKSSVYEQATDEKTCRSGKKLRLFVVSSDMFEEAMRASYISMIELTYTNIFPSDCRMFIGIPIYKDGYINRKDQL